MKQEEAKSEKAEAEEKQKTDAEKKETDKVKTAAKKETADHARQLDEQSRHQQNEQRRAGASVVVRY